jgi:glutamate dehydrogenase/leucine dehydrogenase
MAIPVPYQEPIVEDIKVTSQAWLMFFNSLSSAQKQTVSSLTAAPFSTGTSGVVNDSATWGGYTVGQIVTALKKSGILT